MSHDGNHEERFAGLDALERQAAEAGKLAAREGVELFRDPGSFVELDRVIRPRETHARLRRALVNKRDSKPPQKHGSIPL